MKHLLFLLLFFIPHCYPAALFSLCCNERKKNQERLMKDISFYKKKNMPVDKILYLHKQVTEWVLNRYIPPYSSRDIEWILNIEDNGVCVDIGPRYLVNQNHQTDCAYEWKLNPVQPGVTLVKLELSLNNPVKKSENRRVIETQKFKIIVQEK